MHGVTKGDLMPVYLIVLFSIRDPETFGKYPVSAMESVAQYGGRYLTVVGVPGMQQPKVIEGQPQHDVTVVIEWESQEAIERWYDSPEYTAIRDLRISSTEGWMLAAPEFEMPPH
jgi:uncharacterized protein (DUF1330 family)|tara:strand:- start:53 stop:397 length:345 start_codon:yes stop_codon:yes gene_type:complete